MRIVINGDAIMYHITHNEETIEDMLLKILLPININNINYNVKSYYVTYDKDEHPTPSYAPNYYYEIDGDTYVSKEMIYYVYINNYMSDSDVSDSDESESDSDFNSNESDDDIDYNINNDVDQEGKKVVEYFNPRKESLLTLIKQENYCGIMIDIDTEIKLNDGNVNSIKSDEYDTKFITMQANDNILQYKYLDIDNKVFDTNIPPILKDKLISWHRIKQMKQIGHGAFGTVYKGKLLDNNQSVALKMLDVTHAKYYLPVDKNYTEEDVVASFYWEAANLCLFNHPNIVKLIGVCTERDHRCIVLELSDSDLNKSIENNIEEFVIKEQMKMLLMLSDGLQYIHSRGLIHKDIKIKNILLFENNIVKWADMGVSSADSLIQPTREEAKIVADGIKDPKWMSVEETQGDEATKKSDIFSFGLVMYCMMNKQSEWWSLLLDDVDDNINYRVRSILRRGNLVNKLDINDEWWCSDIIKKCLNDDAESRPSSDELIKLLCNTISSNSEYIELLLQHKLNKSLYTTSKKRQYSYIENLCSDKRGLKVPDGDSKKLTEVIAEEFLTLSSHNNNNNNDNNNNNNNKQVLVLLGDGGTGKSIGLHVIANKFQNKYKFVEIRSHVNEWSLNAIHNFCSNNNNYPNDCIYLYDGHDELVGRDELNVSLVEWLGLPNNSKLIITCRHNIVPLSDESLIFGANHMIRVVLPFSKEQMNEYLSSNTNINSNNNQNMLNKLDANTLNNPLVLSLYVSSVEYINITDEYGRIKRTDIYDAAVRSWYNKAVGIDEEVKSRLGLSLDNFIKFACDTSMLMYCNNNCVSMPLNSNNIMNSPWLKLEECVREVCNEQLNNRHRSILKAEDYINMKLQTLSEEYLSNCPLKQKNNMNMNNNNIYSFVHKSFRDYFCGLAYTKYSNENICKKLVTSDISVQRWCSEFVDIGVARYYAVGEMKSDELLNNESEISFSIRALERVEASKKYKNHKDKNELLKISIGAANCMTILCTAGVALSGRDFSGAQLGRVIISEDDAEDEKKAEDDNNNKDAAEENKEIFMDLGGGILHSCNFRGANLSGVRLQQAMLDKADISECNMRDVIFGEMPSFIGHTDEVNALVKSSDGKYLFSGSGDKTIKQWLIGTGELVRTFEGHTSYVKALTISNDDKYLFSGSYKTIKQWSIVTGELVRTFEGHTSYVNALTISNDDKYLFSGSDDNTIKQWSIATGELVRTFEGHTWNVKALAISNDDKYLFSGSYDETINQWSIATGELVRTFEGHTGSVKALTISNNDKYLFSGSDDKTINQWSTATGELVRTFKGHTYSVYALTISNDDKYLFSGSSDETIKQWSIGTVELVRTFEGHTDYVYALTISNDDKYLFSGSYDDTIKQWSIGTGQLVRTFEGHTRGVNALTISNDDKYLFSGSYDYTIKQWSIATGELINDNVDDADIKRKLNSNRGKTKVGDYKAVYNKIFQYDKSHQMIIWSSAPYKLTMKGIKFDNVVNASADVKRLLIQRY